MASISPAVECLQGLTLCSFSASESALDISSLSSEPCSSVGLDCNFKVLGFFDSYIFVWQSGGGYLFIYWAVYSSPSWAHSFWESLMYCNEWVAKRVRLATFISKIVADTTEDDEP